MTWFWSGFNQHFSSLIVSDNHLQMQIIVQWCMIIAGGTIRHFFHYRKWLGDFKKFPGFTMEGVRATLTFYTKQGPQSYAKDKAI